MGESTEISWCDHTFNPWWGCEKVSEACKHCYAETFSKRVGLKLWGGDATPRRFFGEKHWREVEKWNLAAERDGVRRRVFCASMADVFEDREDLVEPRRRLFALIESTSALDWLLLTKRPEHVSRLAPMAWMRDGFPLNVWMGTTAETQQRLDERIERLLSLPARVRFLSMEPLLERVQIDLANRPIHWVIVGGESGPHARPMHPDWVRAIRDECHTAKVAFHFKQWGEWVPRRQTLIRSSEAGTWGVVDIDGKYTDQATPWNGHDDDGMTPENEAVVFRVGKKRAGRLLDGETHDAFPCNEPSDLACRYLFDISHGDG